MLKRWSLLVILMLALVAFTGCSDDDDPVRTPQSTFDELAAAGIAYVNDLTDCPGVITAADLNDNLDTYTVIDIRGVTDYDNGHISGAYWSTLATLLDDVGTTIPVDKPFVVTCYTGQAAGHAKFALEMMGYEETKSLLWGMSSWSPDVTGSNWNTTTMVADLLGTPQETDNNGDLVEHAFPTMTESLADRVQTVLTNGFQSIAYSAIMDNLDEYFVVNYFGQPDYLGQGTAGVPGHIPGAFQFTPYSSLGVDELLSNLPSDDTTIVVYCWTGQHSSQVTAYLNMLGYNAKSLLYGSNNLFHSSLSSHDWRAEYVMDFPLEATTF
jgi:rhodanese-related sulfurtransferase